MRKLVPFVSMFLIVVGGAFGPVASAGQSQQKPIEEAPDKPQGRAAIRVAVEQVKVDVTVTDDDGNLIQGLKKEHFKLYEDKVEQEITNFAPIEAPITAVLVTEYSKLIPWEWLYEAWMASHLFVDQMRPEDWVAVVAYDMRPEILVDFTQNKAEVMGSLRRLNFPAFRESNLYDTVWDVLDRIQEVDGKVAVILVSSGLDSFSKKNLGEALKKVKRSNGVIYAISLGGHFRARYEHRFGNTLRMDLLQADSTLKSFARYTGGMVFFPRFTQAYPGIFQTISAMLRNQYSLGYISSNPKKDGEYRKIKVEVRADIDGDGKPDDLKVRHREGYLAEEATS